MRATALAHAVLCWCRWLSSNQISTIANGTFAGLTALTELYGAGLWAGMSLLRFVLAWIWGAEGWQSFPRPASFVNGIITSSLPFLFPDLHMLGAINSVPFWLLLATHTHARVCVCVCVCVFVCVGFSACVLVCARCVDVMSWRMGVNDSAANF